MPPVPIDSAEPSTSATPLETIPISLHDFLAIMTSVLTFPATSASFATTHAALVERMAQTKTILAQTNAILAQNNAILMQIQNHLGLPQIPTIPPAAVALEDLAPPTALLDLIAVAAAAAPSPSSPHPTYDGDDIPPSADM